MAEVLVIVDHWGDSCDVMRCYTTSQPSRGLKRRLGGFWSCSKTWIRCQSLYSIVYYIIAQRLAISLDFMRCRRCLYRVLHTCSHMHGLLAMLCHGTRSRNHRKLYSCSDVDFSFSADNHSKVIRPHATVI